MWCKVCQQDAPGIRSRDRGQLCCARCGTELPGSGQPAAGAPSGVGADESPAERPRYDSWETNERLRHIDRVLHCETTRPAPPHLASPQGSARRIDAAEESPRGWHAGESLADRSANRVGMSDRAGSVARRRASDWGDRALAMGVWLALSLGIMALVCGGILLAWSAIAKRPELWSIGLPIAIVGQVALLLSLILQLDRIWHNHRSTAAQLDDFDGQIHDLRSAAAMLTTTHSSPATAFYAHYCGGASPDVLLTDLKSQLDLLAIKIGTSEGGR